MATHIADLATKAGGSATVHGWVKTLRLQRRLQFVLVRDGTGVVQVVNRRTEPPTELEKQLDALTLESAVVFIGTVELNPAVKLGGLELRAESITVVAQAEPGLPVEEDSAPEVRLDWRYLDVRRTGQLLTFQVQDMVEHAMREVAHAEGFVEMHTPKLMATASESGSEVFRVDYFDRSAYLAQSPQFFKQMAIGAGIERFFEIGPVFRAEPSFTSRHATEFTGVDVEMAWIDGVEDVMAFEEMMLARVLERVRDAYGPAVLERFGTEITVPETPFPRIPMRQALSILRDQGWDPEGARVDLDTEGERALSAWVKSNMRHEFVFVTEFPSSIRPFYHHRPADDRAVTDSFDLLWNGIEITTGAQREHRYEVLVKQAAEKGIDVTPMSDYMNVFRYGTPPHGGFGLGLNRLIMVMLGMSSIRESTFLFRGPHRLTP